MNTYEIQSSVNQMTLYTCQLFGNSLDELGIPQNPYFDPYHDSVASFWLISEVDTLNGCICKRMQM